MKRDIHGRFSKTDTIEFPLPSISFIAKYFLLLIILLPWIYLAIYRLNIGQLSEEMFYYLFGPNSCENTNSKKPY